MRKTRQKRRQSRRFIQLHPSDYELRRLLQETDGDLSIVADAMGITYSAITCRLYRQKHRAWRQKFREERRKRRQRDRARRWRARVAAGLAGIAPLDDR